MIQKIKELICKVFGHNKAAWVQINVIDGKGSFNYTMFCLRCGKELS
jgi:hypothetical protein